MSETIRKTTGKRLWWKLPAYGAGHVVGVSTLALVGLWWVMRDVSPDTLLWAEQRGYDFGGQNAEQLLLHVGLCALVWFAVMGIWSHSRATRGVKKVRAAVARRGSVMVETLIALPVMLVLICGLVQMTLLNIAALMTDVAAIQAGRAVYVWQGETTLPRERADGYEIPSTDDIEENARIVASGTLASVAPGTYSSGCSSSSSFRSYMQGTTSTSSLTGLVSGSTGAAVGFAGQQATIDNRVLSAAFDDIGFGARGPRKLATAYCNSEVEFTIDGGNLRTQLTYHHKLTVPITGFAFSTRIGILGERYSTIRRTYILPLQTTNPNPFTPISLLSDLMNLNPFG